MQLRPTLPARTGRLLAGALVAVLMLALGTALGPTQTASANEFVPKPKITYLAQCFNLHQGLHVSFVLSNEGLGNANFHLTKTVDGVVSEEDFSVGFTPATPDYFIPEDSVPSFSVVSTDGAGASFSYDFQKVDCEADPSAAIVVVCPTTPGGSATLQYTYFNPSKMDAAFSFGVPNAPNFDITAGSMAAAATETRDVAEKTKVDVVVTADGNVVASLHTTVVCVVEQDTTTSTTMATTSTTAAPTTTTTQAPTTTTTVDEPTTTVPDPTTTVAPPTSSTTAPAVDSANDDTVPPADTSFNTYEPPTGTLARTGSDTGHLALVGLVLIGIGGFVITARRRLAR